METTVLKVKDISFPKENRTGNGSYQMILVQEYRFIPMGGTNVEVATNKQISRKLSSEMKTKDGLRTIKGDALFNSLTIGQSIAGKIVKRATTPYTINNKTVESFTTVVFDGEDEFKVINNNLRAHGAVALDDEGNKTAEIPQSSVTAPETIN